MLPRWNRRVGEARASPAGASRFENLHVGVEGLCHCGLAVVEQVEVARLPWCREALVQRRAVGEVALATGDSPIG
jgi:hypothetical protein